MIKGRAGIFDVRLDDELIFSKHKTGGFPAHGEVESILRERIA